MEEVLLKKKRLPDMESDSRRYRSYSEVLFRFFNRKLREGNYFWMYFLPLQITMPL